MTVDLAPTCEVLEVPGGSGAPLLAPRTGRLRRYTALSQGALSLVDQAIVSGTSFVTAMLIGRSTTKETMGLYFLIASIVIVAVGVQESIISSPYIIYSKRRSGPALAQFNGSVWFHHLLFTLLGIGGLLAAIGILSATGSTTIAPHLWVLIIAGPLMLLREWIRRFAFSNLEIGAALAVDCVVCAVQLTGLFWLARSGSLSIFGIFAVMALGCLLASAGWFLLAKPDIQLRRERFLPDWRSNWAFGKWTARSYLVGQTGQYIMPWVINLAVSTAAAGVLGACITLINLANLFLTSIDRILTPHAAQAFAEGGVGDLRRVLRLAAMALLPPLSLFCLLVFAFGSQVAAFVYGDQYAGTGAILTVLSLSVLANSVGTVVGNGLWAIDQPQRNFVADVGGLAVTLGSAAVLVQPLGTLGAALALFAGALVAAAIRCYTLACSLQAFDTTMIAPAQVGEPS